MEPVCNAHVQSCLGLVKKHLELLQRPIIIELELEILLLLPHVWARFMHSPPACDSHPKFIALIFNL